MKKFLTPLVALMLLLSLCSIPAMAEVTTIVVETPVSMSLVSETDGNYEYRVTANVTVSAGNTEVNLLMFGNRDNSAFVSGDNVMNLTVEEIASDYNIYYIDQKTAGSDGKVSFVFNVIFPTPAKDDLYYIRVGATDAASTEDLGPESLGVTSQIVSVTLTSDKTEASQNGNIEFTATAENIFGNTVPAEIQYNLSQNNVSVDKAVSNEGVLSCFGLSGNYVITATATPTTGGTPVTSDALSFSVTASALINGDVDGNGKVSVLDAVSVIKHVARTITLEGSALTAADFNADNKISINDATDILRFVARID